MHRLKRGARVPEPETHRGGCAGFKKKNMVLTLSWTVRAKRAPWVRCCRRHRNDSNLTSSIQTAAAGALTIRQMRPAGLGRRQHGLRKLQLHDACQRTLLARVVLRGAASVRDPREPFPNLALPRRLVGTARGLFAFAVAVDVEFVAVSQLDRWAAARL